jgi:hypothetical protein
MDGKSQADTLAWYPSQKRKHRGCGVKRALATMLRLGRGKMITDSMEHARDLLVGSTKR